MRFLLDANIPYSAKEAFPARHTAIHVRDIGLHRAADEVVIGWAKRHRAVLVTRDLDFANILRFPPQRYAGIMVLRLPHFYEATRIKRVLGEFLFKAREADFRKSVIIVEDGRFRIRK